jgi:dienelactone hydrolase
MRIAALAVALPGVIALPAQDGPAALLAEAVGLRTIAERREAALALARRDDVPLQDWLAAMHDFGAFAAVAPATLRESVDAWTRAGIERIEVDVVVPRGYDAATPAPLLLAAHGTGGRGSEVARLWESTAQALGMIVVAPTEAGANEGYRFSGAERDAALSVLRWARRRFNVDENRIFVSGVSRGGHLAWDLALRFPDVFAGCAPMIGGPRLNIDAGQNNVRYVENVARLAIVALQGERDDPLLLFNLRLAFERLAELGATGARLELFADLGHEFRFEAVDWSVWLSAARDPLPGRVVRLAANVSEARAFWIEILAFDKSVAEVFRPRVAEREWQRLDDAQRRRLLQDQTDARTARLEVEQLARGRFRAKSRGVARLRLLLTGDQFAERGPVQVTWNGRSRSVAVTPSKAVLLADFVERFDRTFLPVCEVVIP